MIKVIIAVFAFICMNNIQAQKSNRVKAGKGFTIHGIIHGLPDKKIFTLIKTDANGGADTVQTSMSKNGRFSFSGFVSVPGELYWIRMDTSIKLEKGRRDWISLFMDNDPIKLTGSLSDWPDISIEGSETTLEYKHYLTLEKEQLNVIDQIKRNPHPDTSALTKAVDDFEIFLLKYYNSALDSYLTPNLILKCLLGIDQKKDLYHKLSARAQQSYYGRKLLELIETQERVKKINDLVKEGGVIPDFSFTTPDGTRQTVMEVASKAKYTLIDFWASWCAPCRASIPHWKEVYEKYHDRGFNILAISTDKREKAWKDALAKDNTPWNQGMDNIDLAGKNIFPLAAIPAYILVDSKGRIIHTDFVLVSGSRGMQFKIVKEGKSMHEVISDLFL